MPTDVYDAYKNIVLSFEGKIEFRSIILELEWKEIIRQESGFVKRVSGHYYLPLFFLNPARMLSCCSCLSRNCLTGKMKASWLFYSSSFVCVWDFGMALFFT